MRETSVLVLGWLLLWHSAAFGQSAQTMAAAKKEGGKVIVYTSMETFTADALKKAFEAKTGLQMEYWRGGVHRSSRSSPCRASSWQTPF